MTTNADFQRERFSPGTLEALFEAVEINDVIDPVVSLPDPILLACTQEQIIRCFALCLQFWEDGVMRLDLLRLVSALLRDRDLDSARRKEYKLIRARYKHLRFALTLYGAHHKSIFLFRLTVVTMGHLQDAFRHRRGGIVLVQAVILRVLLAKPLWAFVKRKLREIPLDTPEGFTSYRRDEIHLLKMALRRELFTGHQFHAVRKIISRQVSFYDTLRSIEPGEEALKMSRFLSAINGLMGNRHDEMIERAISRKRDYRIATPLSNDIRQKLELLVANYPL